MKSLITLASVLVVSLPLLSNAQASRTWVSGVGDDLNPASRTAPALTFAGAISNTAPGGIIDVLDPGDFGPVTITKSINIDGDENEGNITISNSNPGIIINVGSNNAVTLRNLSFEGLGVGTSAIQILSASAVHIENCRIDGFVTGIEDDNSVTNGRIFVKDTTIQGCDGIGIILLPTAPNTATIQNVKITACGIGIGVNTNATADVIHSTVCHNISGGIASAGLVRLSASTISDNGAQGLLADKPGQIVSYRNNVVTGNSPDGKPTSFSTLK
jgi:hypothetical protein